MAAISLLPEMYRSQPIQSKDWPESSLVSYLWNSVEDWILEEWQKHIASNKFTHLSLHVDGVLVDAARVSLSENDFGSDCARAIADSTGFQVVIRRKLHRGLCDIIRDKAKERLLLVPDRAELKVWHSTRCSSSSQSI